MKKFDNLTQTQFDLELLRLNQFIFRKIEFGDRISYDIFFLKCFYQVDFLGNCIFKRKRINGFR